jgi:hypothetical protein
MPLKHLGHVLTPPQFGKAYGEAFGALTVDHFDVAEMADHLGVSPLGTALAGFRPEPLCVSAVPALIADASHPAADQTCEQMIATAPMIWLCVTTMMAKPNSSQNTVM